MNLIVDPLNGKTINLHFIRLTIYTVLFAYENNRYG